MIKTNNESEIKLYMWAMDYILKLYGNEHNITLDELKTSASQLAKWVLNESNSI